LADKRSIHFFPLVVLGGILGDSDREGFVFFVFAAAAAVFVLLGSAAKVVVVVDGIDGAGILSCVIAP